MGVNTQKYIRKPLYVEAVRVTPDNFDELANWCQGEIETKNNSSRKNKKYIKVRVHHPKNPRQTQAFVGDWILYTDRGYKVYTNDAFNLAFDLIEEKIQPEKPSQVTSMNTASPSVVEPSPATVVPGADLGSTPQGEKIEVVEATPEAIAEVVRWQQDPPRELKEGETWVEGRIVPIDPALLEDTPSPSTGIPKMEPTTPSEGAGPGGNEFAVGETPIAPPPTPAIVPPEEPRLQTETGPVALDEAEADHKIKEPGHPEPVSQQPPENAAEGKYVLSEKEQADLGPEGVREMLASGEAILAQDLAETA